MQDVVKRKCVKLLVKAFFLCIILGWVVWSKAKRALILIIYVKLCHLSYGFDFSPLQPISDCVSFMVIYST